MEFQFADNTFLKAKSERTTINLKDVVLSIITLGIYGAFRNYKRAENLYKRFIKAADTDGDGNISLADQEKYLLEHGIKLNTITLPEGINAVQRNISILDPGRYMNAAPSVKVMLDNLEKRLFPEGGKAENTKVPNNYQR